MLFFGPQRILGSLFHCVKKRFQDKFMNATSSSLQLTPLEIGSWLIKLLGIIFVNLASDVMAAVIDRLNSGTRGSAHIDPY